MYLSLRVQTLFLLRKPTIPFYWLVAGGQPTVSGSLVGPSRSMHSPSARMMPWKNSVRYNCIYDPWKTSWIDMMCPDLLHIVFLTTVLCVNVLHLQTCCWFGSSESMAARVLPNILNSNRQAWTMMTTSIVWWRPAGPFVWNGFPIGDGILGWDFVPVASSSDAFFINFPHPYNGLPKLILKYAMI